MNDDCPELIDDIDACYWCSNCRLRLEDCTCHFQDEEEGDLEDQE